MPRKRTPKRPPPKPIELTAEQRERFAELTKDPDLIPCDVCAQGWRLPQKVYTSKNGTRWRVCVVCAAMLRDMDRLTRNQALYGLLELQDLMMLRVPYYRDWLTTRTLYRDEQMEAA